MWLIKFNDGKVLSDVEFTFTGNTVIISTDEKPDLSGFCTVNNGIPVSNYDDYITLYDQGDGWYQLSNDGSAKPKPTYTVMFKSTKGGKLEGELEQVVVGYRQLTVPKVIADPYYAFTEWSPAIPKSGALTENVTFTANFKYMPEIVVGNISYPVTNLFVGTYDYSFDMNVSKDEAEAIFNENPTIVISDSRTTITNYSITGMIESSSGTTRINIHCISDRELLLGNVAENTKNIASNSENIADIENQVVYQYEVNSDYENSLIQLYELLMEE